MARAAERRVAEHSPARAAVAASRRHVAVPAAGSGRPPAVAAAASAPVVVARDGDDGAADPVDEVIAAVAAAGRLVDRMSAWRDALVLEAFRSGAAMRRAELSDALADTVAWEWARTDMLAELALALRVPESAVLGQVRRTAAVTRWFPRLAGAYSAGRVSRWHVDVMLDVVERLPEGVREAADEALTPRAEALDPSRFRAAARRWRARHGGRITPEARRAAAADRHVTVAPADDHLAWLSALLPAEQAYAAFHRISDIAAEVQGPDDGRTLPQLRADVLSALLIDPESTLAVRSACAATDASHPGVVPPASEDGRDVATERLGPGGGTAVPGSWGLGRVPPGSAELQPPPGVPHPPAVADEPAADLRTAPDVAAVPDVPDVPGVPGVLDVPDVPGVLDVPDVPGALDVPGVPGVPGMPAVPDVPAVPEPLRGISATVVLTVPVLTLLGHGDEPPLLEGHGPIDIETARRLAADAPSFIRVLTDPHSGAVLSVGRRRYAVPADLRTALAVRDGTCRFPGCSRRAARCDVDHSTSWAAGGETAVDNLAHLCRKHHRLKHLGRWRVRHEAGGVLVWSTPSGREYRTEPAVRLDASPPTGGTPGRSGPRPPTPPAYPEVPPF